MSGTPATPEMEYLGQLCFVQRKALRLTLEDVAIQVGSSKSYIWEIEHGQAMPSFLLMARICHVLGIGVGSLASGVLKVAELAAWEAEMDKPA